MKFIDKKFKFTEHAKLFHRSNSIKPSIDKVYCEKRTVPIKQPQEKTKCLHRKSFIVMNEGRCRRRFKLSALFTIKLSKTVQFHLSNTLAIK